MFSIDLLRERISGLHTLEDLGTIKEEIKNISHDIIYAEDSFYIAIYDGTPFFAPYVMNGQDAGQFLRLFTHKEIADVYLSKHKDQSIQQVSVVESVQLAKSYFIKGGFGFILNEGDKWVNIPFADYLEVFFERIQCNDVMFSKECAELLVFLNELNSGHLFHYNTFTQADKLASVNGELLIFSKDFDMSMITEKNPDLQQRSVSIQDLYDIKEPVDICIMADDRTIKTSSEFILGALKYQKTSLSLLEKETDWHTKDVSLLFDIDKMPQNESVDNDNTESDFAFSDEEKLSESATAEDLILEKADEEINHSKLSELKNRIRVLIDSFKLPNFSIKRSNDNIETADADIVEIEVQDEFAEPKNKNFKWLNNKKLPVKTIIICVIAIIFLIIAGMFVSQHNKEVKAFELFCNYVDNSEFGNAYALYNDYDFNKDADKYLKDKLDRLTLAYAADEIRLEELKASIQSLSNFPAMQQELEVARLTAAKLESSKTAYNTGNNAGSAYEKLDVWRQVIELDSANYAAVQEAVQENQKLYQGEIQEELEYYSTRIRDFAKARYEVLAYWYPDSDITQEWSQKYLSDNSSLLSIYPVAVYNIDIKQELDSYWTLHIDWKNKSVKTIKSIRFSLVALDEKGNIVTCSDSQGEWTVFDAVDPHEYAPGDGSFNKDYKWNKSFYGSLVAAVKLTGVYIEYVDGSTTSYTDEQTLLEMQK